MGAVSLVTAYFQLGNPKHSSNYYDKGLQSLIAIATSRELSSLSYSPTLTIFTDVKLKSKRSNLHIQNIEPCQLPNGPIALSETGFYCSLKMKLLQRGQHGILKHLNCVWLNKFHFMLRSIYEDTSYVIWIDVGLFKCMNSLLWMLHNTSLSGSEGFIAVRRDLPQRPSHYFGSKFCTKVFRPYIRAGVMLTDARELHRVVNNFDKILREHVKEKTECQCFDEEAIMSLAFSCATLSNASSIIHCNATL